MSAHDSRSSPSATQLNRGLAGYIGRSRADQGVSHIRTQFVGGTTPLGVQDDAGRSISLKSKHRLLSRGCDGSGWAARPEVRKCLVFSYYGIGFDA